MNLNYFNFKPFKDRILLTNDYGKYAFLTADEFKRTVAKDIAQGSDLYERLIKSKMIYEESDMEHSATSRYEYREVKNYVNMATSLHIFVVTTACNMQCVYCQANSDKNHSNIYMTERVAERAVDIALQSPSKNLSFEFQGGEPLLNFKIIMHIVKYAEQHKGNHRIHYNVVSNLLLLTEQMIDFFAQYDFSISTSIDGPCEIHDKNRMKIDGCGSFSELCSKVDLLRHQNLYVGAIQTTTRASLNHAKEIVSAYQAMGFDSIFLRPLTPLGRALTNWSEIGYTAEEFIAFYREAIDELITINQQGHFLKEEHMAMQIKKINGLLVNYMELRSPCGAGVGQIAYFANGNIYTCDEGRMLAEMGTDAFKIGNVFTDSYTDVISSGVCKTACQSSILEALPSCCDCVYQPYCGVCPAVNYALYGDIIEKAPRGYKCRIYAGIFDTLFSMLLEDQQSVISVLDSWGN